MHLRTKFLQYPGFTFENEISTVPKLSLEENTFSLDLTKVYRFRF